MHLLLYLCMPIINVTTNIITMIMATITTVTTVTVIEELLDDALSVAIPIKYMKNEWFHISVKKAFNT